MKGFSALIEDIREGKYIDQADILPYLCSESREERSAANAKLAQAYFQAGNIQQAKVFIDRAWILSNFSVDILGLYVNIHKALDDIDSIREAYKRIGMVKAKSGNMESALSYFYQSMYAYAFNQKGDYYEYDFDILDAIEGLAEPHRFSPTVNAAGLAERKTRLAYLVFGAQHPQSVIVKILSLFAEFHDKERFEVAFFVPENELSNLSLCKTFQGNIEQLMKHGNTVFVPNGTTQEDMLYETAKRIYDYQPDILITSALLADFKQYFIASLRPAPIIIGFSQGPPPQFSAPLLDWSISWTKHSLIDCPGDASLVDMEVTLPKSEDIPVIDRASYGIPDDGIVLVSAGRPPKFLDRGFWKAIIDLLKDSPKAYFVAIGLNEEPSFLREILTEDLRERIKFLGWMDDYVRILKLADIMIDTYPSGGGVTLMDAMALGIPVISFRNNYMKIFNQTDWSPAEEFIEIPDLLAERYDFDHFRKVASRLIEDKDFRQKMGDSCRSQINSRKGHPERMVRRCEKIYKKILKTKSSDRELPKVDSIEKTAALKNIYDLMEERVSFWNFNKELYNRVDSKMREHQALQQSKAVILARKLGEHPILLKMATAGYEVLAKIYHRFRGR